MTKYEEFLIKAESLGVSVKEIDFGDDEECGYYSDSKVLINSNLTESQKLSVLAEELGHHIYTYGDITDQSKIENKKQEKVARNWAYEKLIGIIDIINAFNKGCRNFYEMANHLDVTEKFLRDAIEYYRNKYGLLLKKDNYIVYFDPNFGVLKMFK
ncbi:ImmA/IrrE family metallo-endopeptidase [Clostridium sp. YIM B02506]|uniref:ImmA/IrrE family metallo-endopeptidase n=1 Tax=Clostridium sp. YIM B02506 TaxID=2910680 RepID=UPI001EEDFFE7|nr:ImmA/IrrE family metallo-endopeptidase [Clostridium sp. YIM B02506]